MSPKVLLTGGSGFLGQNLARALKQEMEVVLCSRNERNLQRVASALDLPFYPMDVSNEFSVFEAFRRLKPDFVIHAAATKFVDLSEKFPNECIDINVRGSQNVARAASHFDVQSVIGISTDKVTSPIANTYGYSKAIMERLFLLQDTTSETKFMCVRYGNVTWSTGSVFPIWEKMSFEKKQIFSTGPNMFRFFFSVQDAVSLVLTALNNVDVLRGKVLSAPMKGARISRVLDVWSTIYKVPWSASEKRFGDREFELLISENELTRTKHIELNGRPFFQLSLHEESSEKQELHSVYSSATAPQLNNDELASLIIGKPEFV